MSGGPGSGGDETFGLPEDVPDEATRRQIMDQFKTDKPMPTYVGTPKSPKCITGRDVPRLRERVTIEQIDALRLHPDWQDGRHGYLFCRLDAIVCRERMLRAEITWLDDGEQVAEGTPLSYYDAQILFETNNLRPDGTWGRIEEIHVDITFDTIVEIVARPPAELLQKFSSTIYALPSIKDGRFR